MSSLKKAVSFTRVCNLTVLTRRRRVRGIMLQDSWQRSQNLRLGGAGSAGP